MENFIVEGQNPLKGTVQISGSKNAVLPILCATLLTDQECTIKNVPNIDDVRVMLQILELLGSKVHFEGNTVVIKTGNIKTAKLPNELIRKMRASILLAGPIIARTGEIKVDFPGGCVLGKRSVDAHTFGFKKMGIEVLDEVKRLHLKAKKLKGADILMPEMSVTGTENMIMAAVLAKGLTHVRLSACEPHVQDLCHFLNKMGAKIKGIGTPYLTIEGVKKLKGAEYKVIGDYLEAGTFAIACAATRGDVEISGFNSTDLDAVWQKMDEVGVPVEFKNNKVRIRPAKTMHAVNMLKTAVYPGFPTDLQAPFAVLLTQAKGVSKIFETLFEGRLNYLFELEKMGARIEFLNPHQAIIIGETLLKGLPIASCDIRAGAAMVVAALAAQGTTEVSNINYIDRGYEKLEEKLTSLGAKIERTPFQ